MNKKNFKFSGLVLAFITTLLMSMSSCSGEDCITCRLGGQVDSICEEELDQYNLLNGTNVTSLSQLKSVVEVAGGSCD